MSGIRSRDLVAIDTDYIGICKSNYHTITTTTAPRSIMWFSIFYRINNKQLLFFPRIIFISRIQFSSFHFGGEVQLGINFLTILILTCTLK